MLREVRDRVNCSFASLFHSPHPSLAFLCSEKFETAELFIFNSPTHNQGPYDTSLSVIRHKKPLKVRLSLGSTSSFLTPRSASRPA